MTTQHFTPTLNERISDIENSLPTDAQSSNIIDMITSQESTSTVMAQHLESLAQHYDQMASALHDSEAGEDFGEEDLQAMNRDTEELPAIMAELEDNISTIEES
jgi:autophagy-related protein 17